MIVDLNVGAKKVIVIGGGIEGMRKIKGLLGQSCDITVISNRLNKELLTLNQKGEVKLIKRKINDASILNDFKNIFLILAATDNKTLNRELVAKGRTMGSFVYAADDPSISDFSYASLTNIMGVIQVAISTSGKSPIMARTIRMKVERFLHKIIKTSDVENIILQDFARKAAKEKIKTVKERKEFLYSLLKNKDIQNYIGLNQLDEAKLRTLKLLDEWEAITHK